ncbi:hypothetical protein [Devosia naphthalenivorans]|uniref:hypothetical protein n=1 Tax=Devosia naphthalenivorans TaxID=2082392 RepID=UPI000D3442F9|nr:hypothetical protein [Devosia naphthalenivorans]
MSLCRIALRIAAVEALKGRTLVGDHVLDSPNGAMDVQADGSLRTEEERPFIAVYTDQGKAEGLTGRTLIENGVCDIVFEMGISAAMTELDKSTGATTLIGIEVPASDSTKEFYLDVVQRQLADALNDPENAWGEIYRGLHYRVRKTEFVGARNADDGQRLAGHQLRITVDLADDPVMGEELDPQAAFAQFLAALEATSDSTYLTQAATIRSLLTGTDEPWQSLQRRNGMTASELLALGRGPLANDKERATPPMSAGTAEWNGGPTVTETGS